MAVLSSFGGQGEQLDVQVGWARGREDEERKADGLRGLHVGYTEPRDAQREQRSFEVFEPRVGKATPSLKKVEP